MDWFGAGIMDWFGAGINGPMVVVRAIHFAATAMTAGTLMFRTVVAEPALGSTQMAPAVVQLQINRVAWIALATAAASGVIWLLLQAASMSGLPLAEAMNAVVLSTILNETQFGRVAEIRLALAIVLAGCLALDRFALPRWLALCAALGLVAAIAWTGHAGSTPGATGAAHLAADALHLCAAAGWIGGLVSLALLLAAARRHQALASTALVADVVRRFSTLGVVSVVTIIISGIINAWILVGSFRALVITDYGRVLMLKIAVFAVMLAFAAVNRLWLTPQLALPSKGSSHALRSLTRNSVIEIVLGCAIFIIVGLLGTLHPAIHLVHVE